MINVDQITWIKKKQMKAATMSWKLNMQPKMARRSTRLEAYIRLLTTNKDFSEVHPCVRRLQRTNLLKENLVLRLISMNSAV